jgi:hypothetical protein
MALHIIKLCVGCDSLSDLADWQKKRLKEKRAKGQKPELIHVTRQMPKRAEELLDGGSLYWVIKGSVQCRQLITEIRPFIDDEGIGRCHLMLNPEVVRTDWQPRRAFQGWRYLKPSDAPADIGKGKAGMVEMPPKLKRELADLGLL